MQAEHNLDEHAQWKQIQQNTFTRWTNEHLKSIGSSIDNLETDLSDGVRLIGLIEVLSQKQLPPHNKRTTFRSQKLENVSIALQFLQDEGIKIVNIDSSDIVDGKLKLILGLIWTLILHYSISMPVWEGDEEKPSTETGQTPKQRLLAWIQIKIPGMSINNFTKDWTTGKPVGALVDACAPGLCPDWELWDPDNSVQNATEAMQLADDWLDVRQLIKPEELVDPNVDEQSVMTYLAQYPNCKLKDGAPLRPKSDPNNIPIVVPVTPVIDPEPVIPVVESPVLETVPAEVYPGIESVPAEVYPGIESVPAEVYPGIESVPAEVHPGSELEPPQFYPSIRPSAPMVGESAIVTVDTFAIPEANYVTEIGKLYEGVSYLFTGQILPEAQGFAINFVYDNQTRDVALHINPRFGKQYVVRNTRIRGTWGREEIHSVIPFPLRQGERFAVQVLVTQNCYLISFNGHHVDHFIHRHPYDTVRFLDVEGDVEDVLIHRSEVRGYPHRFLELAPPPHVQYDIQPMIYFADDVAEVGPLCEADSFLFSGRIDAKSQELEISFLYANETRDVPLHIKFQFKKNHLIRNSRARKSWNREEISSPIPVRRGERFAVQVLVTSDCYLIAINGQHYAQYVHRMPFDAVAVIEVKGGVQDVQMHRNTVRDYPQGTLQRQIL
ncbi:uncharacterized protein LOC115761414 [Drosophila novamexicana]|uniref:uncharacterized protein LOC115761414 n=1 Tax=Drosophila novamexicana TaxID=47314 RepID=UPI0011E5C472|nr:uncharacterized protein LOC115761414 [Drosophila novamexicana]